MIPTTQSESPPILLFDLDGTLADTRRDLLSAVRGTLVDLLLPVPSDDVLSPFIGRGMRSLLERSLRAARGGGRGGEATAAMSERAAHEALLASAVEHFERRYAEERLRTTVLYPGVHATLQALRRCGMGVVTNKPVHHARAVLDGLGVLDHFSVVIGGGSSAALKPAPDPVFEALTRMGAAPGAFVLLVGDSLVDIETARAAQIAVCAALHGFESTEVLLAAQPDAVIESFPELRTLPMLSAWVDPGMFDQLK